MSVAIAAAVVVFAVTASPATATAPANDDFSSALALASGGGTLDASNVDATKEPREPDHGGDAGAASIWFSWTPNFTGVASVDTAGSSFDTLLAAYTGTAVDALSLSASNDDVTDNAATSRICFPVVAGETWKIAVDGYDGVTGSVVLNWGQKTDSVPCPTLPPEIDGPASPLVGDRLDITPGTFADQGTSASERWYRCAGGICTPIGGATDSSYVLTKRDVGTALKLETASSDGTSTAYNQSGLTSVVGMTAQPHPNGRIVWSQKTVAGATTQLTNVAMFADGSGQLLNNSATLGELAVSPDGTQIIGETPPAGNLFLMPSDFNGPTRGQSQIVGQSPTWSPDGSRIAFLADDQGVQVIDVWDVSAGDAAITTIATFASGTGALDLRWSPDGTEFAVSYIDYSDPTPNYDIGVLAADGSGPIYLLTSSTEPDFAPTWSPTGAQLAFTRGVLSGNPGTASLWVINADGSGEHELYAAGPSQAVQASAWSPDGSTIVFNRYDQGVDSGHSHSDLFTIPAAGGQPTQLTHAADGGANAEPAWGPLVSFPLTITTTGAGAVTSAPAGISCGTTCQTSFIDAAAVTLTPTPSAGSTFVGWSGACAGTGSCVVPMYGPRAVTAAFTSAPAPAPPPSPSTGGGGGGGGGGAIGDLTETLTATATNAPPVGSEVVLSATVELASPGNFSDTALQVALPDGLTFERAYTDRGNCSSSGGLVNCDTAFISPGIETHVTIWAQVARAGQLDVTANVRSLLEPDSNVTDNTATVTLSPATASAQAPTQKSAPAAQIRAVTPPRIAGAAVVGGTLQVMAPAWSTAPSRVTYQWLLCVSGRCGAIRNATARTLRIRSRYVGKEVGVMAIAHLGGRIAKSTSPRVVVGRRN